MSHTNQQSAKIKILGTISTLGPIGMRLPAPGTWGSFAGVIFYIASFQYAGINTPENLISFLVWSLLLVAIAIPICDAGEKLLGRTDPGEVNFDEFAVMPICFSGLGGFIAETSSHERFYWFLAGFAIFRAFDIFKPFGIKRLQKLKGGLGVVADDFAAALATCAVLWAARFIIA